VLFRSREEKFGRQSRSPYVQSKKLPMTIISYGTLALIAGCEFEVETRYALELGVA
jgi:hypothetical protein